MLTFKKYYIHFLSVLFLIALVSIAHIFTLPSAKPFSQVAAFKLPFRPRRIAVASAKGEWAFASQGDQVVRMGNDGVYNAEQSTPEFINTSIQCTSDGDYVTGDENGFLARWRPGTVEPIWWSLKHGRVYDVLLLSTNTSVICSADDSGGDFLRGGVICEWNLASGIETRILFRSKRSTPLRLASDARCTMVASLLSDGEAVIVDLMSGEVVFRVECQPSRMRGSMKLPSTLDLSSDGSLLSICGEFGVLTWNVADKRLSCKYHFVGAVDEVRFMHTRQVLLGVSGRRLYAWSTANGRILGYMTLPGEGGRDLTLSSDDAACIAIRNSESIVVLKGCEIGEALNRERRRN